MCPSEAADLEDPAAARAGAILTIDLDAVADNYRRLCAELGGTACAAVVKADAYGLGMARVAPALARAGVRTFFVAQLEEATALRAMFPIEVGGEAAVEIGVEIEIFVLNGLAAGPVAEFQAGRVHPVLNSLGEIGTWAAAARAAGRALPAAVHIDTGMSRLGLPDDELAALAADRSRLAGIDLRYLVSHLACADRPEHPLNAEQLRRFQAARAPARRAGQFCKLLRDLFRRRLPPRPGPPGSRPLRRQPDAWAAQSHAPSGSPARQNSAGARD